MSRPPCRFPRRDPGRSDSRSCRGPARGLLRALVLGVLTLMIPSSLPAHTPSGQTPVVQRDPIPRWLDLRIDLPSDLAFGQENTLNLKISATLTPLAGVSYTITLPEGMSSTGGALAGTVDLDVGAEADIPIPVVIQKVLDGQTVVAQVQAPFPREALTAAVEKEYPASSKERLRAETFIRTADAQALFMATRTLSSRPEETWTAEEGVAFGTYVTMKDGRTFPLLQTMPGPDAAALEAREQELEQSLTLYSQPPAHGEDDMFAELKENALRDRFNVRHQRVALLVIAGDWIEAEKAADRLEVPASLEGPGTLACTATLKAAVAYGRGQSEGAREILEEVLDKLGRDPVSRYVHLALGEIHTAGGRKDEARKAYRRALSLKANYSLARSRLDDAGGR